MRKMVKKALINNKPNTARLNGKVEPSFRPDDIGIHPLLLYTGDIKCNTKLTGWEKFYNSTRPYTAVKGKTPYEVLLDPLR